MKKSILQLICLLLSLVLVTGVLFSCAEQKPQEPSTDESTDESTDNDTDTPSGSSSSGNSNKTLAFQLYEKVDEAMEKVTSYTETGIASMEHTMYGMRMVMNTSATITVTGYLSDQFNYRLAGEALATMYVENEVVSKIEQSMTQGFENGKMFYNSRLIEDENAPQDTKLYSELSAADYQSFMKLTQEDITISAQTCQNASCKQNDDKTWTATYSGFDQQTIRKAGIDTYVSLLGSDVQWKDMKITLTLTEEYYPVTMRLDFSFALTDPSNTEITLPTLSSTSTFKDINTTQAPQTMDVSGYTKVDDLRAPELLDKALNDYLDSASGKFEVSTVTHVTAGTNVTNENLTQEATFENQNGRLSCKIKSTDNDGTITYTYEDGVFLMSMDGYMDSMDYTDLTARVDLFDILHPVSFSIDEIKDITVLSQSGNSTRYFIEFKGSEIVDEILSMGGTLTSGNYGLTVTLTDGKVTAYNYSLAAIMTYMEQTMNMDVTIDVILHQAN